jgi:ABC-2 type transport system ATP-binding protein
VTAGPVIDAVDLRMRYGPVDVLRGVTLHADRGEVVALLGPNGAGKTTTIEILEGFRTRSAGQAAVLGVDPGQGDESWRARLGVVLQSWRDHGRWRAREFLDYQASYYTAYAATRPVWDVDELMAAVGLSERADVELRRLSGGQRRRLDLAIGLVGRPEVLFLDEPTAGLDPEARREFHDLLRGVAEPGDTTVLITTHDLDEADRVADRILILVGGQVIADGTATQLAHQIAGLDAVRWTYQGRRFTQDTPDSTAFALDLFRRHGDAVSELEVRRASLEDTYLTLVREAEAATTATATADHGVREGATT